MNPVTLDDATVGRLRAANGRPVPLFNSVGEVIGYYLSAAQFAEFRSRTSSLHDAYSPEELVRLERERANDPRPDVTHEEVLRWLKEQ
jgi:hypothetical protein